MNKHHLANCDECPLRANTFFLQPSKQAEVLFVGGGPNESEAFKGGFYSTPAGKLVNSVCSFHNIPRADTTYVSSVGCVGLSDLNARDRKKALSCCNDLLFNQIDKVDPKVVVTLGNEALVATTGKSGVASHRVGPAKVSTATETPLIPTVSPWACLAQESQFKFLVTDIGKVVNPAPVFTAPEPVKPGAVREIMVCFSGTESLTNLASLST